MALVSASLVICTDYRYRDNKHIGIRYIGCTEDWSTLLKETKGEAKATKEQKYVCIAEGEEGFIEVMFIANGTFARLTARITLILQSVSKQLACNL